MAGKAAVTRTVKDNVLPAKGLLVHSGNGATRSISQMPSFYVIFMAHCFNLSFNMGAKCGLQTVWVILIFNTSHGLEENCETVKNTFMKRALCSSALEITPIMNLIYHLQN